MTRQRFQGRRCVVVGGAGTPAVALARELVALGAEVHAIAIPNSTVRGLASLSECDPLDGAGVTEAVRRIGAVVNVAFHCGAPVPVEATAGAEAFDLDELRRSFTRAIVEVMVEGSVLVSLVSSGVTGSSPSISDQTDCSSSRGVVVRQVDERAADVDGTVAALLDSVG